MADVTGGEAIRRLLDKVDVPGRIEEIKRDLPEAHGSRRTALNRELKYLQALDQEGLKPSEAFIVKKMPVIPAAMRPIYADERGTLISSDINTLYRDVGAVNEKLRAVEGLPDRHKEALRQDLYDGVKAVQGLGDPISENPSLKGIFRQLSGRSSPKGGFFQGRVVRSRQNLSGRATITLGNDPRRGRGGPARGDGVAPLPRLGGPRAGRRRHEEDRRLGGGHQQDRPG